MQDHLIISGKTFDSRLILGTGKYPSPQIMKEAIDASGCAIVTAAVRRVDFNNPEDHLLSHIGHHKIFILPNTSGARNHEEAVRLARLAAAGVGHKWVKLEVTPEPRFLLPDPIETFKAAEILIKEGFTVMPYINADPILAKRLEEIGCATVMPLGSPIGTNQGLKTKDSLKIIIEMARVPVIVDAGIGKPSDAAECLEMGASAVMINTAIATAENPAKMALAFKLAVEAGRLAYLSKIPQEKHQASASSPLAGRLQ